MREITLQWKKTDWTEEPNIGKAQRWTCMKESNVSQLSQILTASQLVAHNFDRLLH